MRSKREIMEGFRDPNRPDNLDVRLELVRQVEAGEITPEEMRTEVLRLKRLGRKEQP